MNEQEAAMRLLSILALIVLLVGCATAPRVTQVPDGLLDDQLFGQPSESIRVADIFAVSPAMKQYINTEMGVQIRAKGATQGLYEALYSKRQLLIDYDSASTRDAADTFAARSGNCLSLVIMTAAFAKELGLPVRYQSAYAEETWSRDKDTYYFIGHINISLGKRSQERFGFATGDNDHLTIDFVAPTEMRAMSTRDIEEYTVVAMYMNNRAAEALAKGQIDDAYAWARTAILQDPGFMSAYNTLGVVYQRHGNLPQAERVLRVAMASEPHNTRVMSNLAGVLRAEGNLAEAASLSEKLARMEPDPPFSFFNRGLQAMREHDFKEAREMFAIEVNRAPYYGEFHFWLAAAYVGLGQLDNARRELNVAMEYSTTRGERDLYAAKLDHIRASQLQ
jgi:Flp pilus assembly protein TadD